MEDNDDFPREVFGPLVDIPDSALVQLATNIGRSSLNITDSDNGQAISRMAGSYNIVHIVQFDSGTKLVIRVPATGWGSGLTDAAARVIESHAATVRLIRQKTSIPVPEIFAFDTSCDNPIGAPYLCMAFVPGQTVSNCWFNNDDGPSREKLRLNILTSVAQNLAQLRCFSFSKIGSIVPTKDDTGEFEIGPCYSYGHENEDEDDETVTVEASGPFDSMEDFLRHHVVPNTRPTILQKAQAKIMPAVLDCLSAMNTDSDFVLMIPDFDSQNIMVDDEGTVTGVIDWDECQTMPRFMGFARYPGWITRDWDPLMYGWPHIETEDSPELLQKYRRHYNKEMGRALDWQGDWSLTGNSHVGEAMWIAALNTMTRLEICRKLIEEALGGDTNAYGVLQELGSDEYEDEWPELVAAFKRLAGGGVECSKTV